MGHWATVATSQLLTRDPFMAISIALSLALMLGVYEMVAGWWRALVVTIVCALAGPLIVAAGLGIGSVLGNGFAGRTLSTLDYGASAVTAGAGGALVAVLAMRRLRDDIDVRLRFFRDLVDAESVHAFGRQRREDVTDNWRRDDAHQRE